MAFVKWFSRNIFHFNFIPFSGVIHWITWKAKHFLVKNLKVSLLFLCILFTELIFYCHFLFPFEWFTCNCIWVCLCVFVLEVLCCCCCFTLEKMFVWLQLIENIMLTLLPQQYVKALSFVHPLMTLHKFWVVLCSHITKAVAAAAATTTTTTVM